MGDSKSSEHELLSELEHLRRENRELKKSESQHRREDALLRESEERYRLLVEASPDAVVLYNPEGKVLYVNPAFVSIYGWTREEWLGRRIDFVPSGHGRTTKDAIKRTMLGETVEFETQRLTKDGRLLEIHIKTAPFRNAQGQVAGTYVIHHDITEAKANLAALLSSEARYRQLLDASPDPITVYDDKGGVTYVNPIFEQTFGWTKEELAGKGIDFVPAHEMERTFEAVQRTLLGENQLLETQRLTKDGRMLDIQLATAVFRDPEGTIAGDIVIYRDITARKRAEEALRESEKRYRLLLDASPDPITVYDEKGSVAYINPAFEQTFGWNLAELVGQGIDFVPADEMERTIDAVQRTLKGETVLLETRRLTKEGRVLDIQLKTAAITDPEGEVIGDIVIYRDISERKKAEAELRRHQDHLEELVSERTGELSLANQLLQKEIKERERTSEALRSTQARYRQLYEESKRAEALFRSLLDSSPDAIIVYDLKGRVQYLNPAFTATFGWSLEDLHNRRLDFVPPSERKITEKRVKATVRDGVVRRDFQTKRLTKDGRILHVNISGARFDDHEGKPTGILSVLRDTTERIKAQKERERLEAQLRQAQKMEAVGVLASGIAHDFNNILQAISGYLQLMDLKQPHDVNISVERLREMDRLVSRGAELVRGLLTFGRKMEPELTPVDLNHSVVETVRMLERTIPKMVRIQTDLADDLWPIQGDANQLEQVLMNLASNACDAMPGGGRLSIKTRNVNWSELCVEQDQPLDPRDYVLLQVSDTGEGMDPETVEHIFEPFYTTKGVSKGTGLGLSTIYGIVKGHGGNIVCTSSPGKGALFEVYLPTASGVVVESMQGEADYTLDTLSGRETILLVDDEKSIRETAQAALSSFGYHTITAASGEEALRIFEKDKDRIGLVLLDLGMPGMGGLKCLKQLLHADACARVVIASGYSASENIQQARQAGAMGFIAKPYRLAEMVKTIRHLLDSQ